MLAVVVILGFLMTVLVPVVGKMRERARQTDCQSNLRQFGTALIVYRADHRGDNPPWLSNLYPDYIDDKSLYICKSDPARGMGRIKPEAIEGDEFEEVIDNQSRDSVRRSYPEETRPNWEDIKANSYFYEFSAANCSWKGDDRTWAEVKIEQMNEGDAASDYKPYSTSRFPIIRCYHHYQTEIPGYANESATTITPQPLTYNVAYAGNVFIAPLWWEGRLEPGEEEPSRY